MNLLPVDDALRRLLDGVGHLEPETVSLREAAFRVLARDVAAGRTQPPADVSAMDGYAVRAADIATVPAGLTVTGEAAAGHGFSGHVGPGEAVRIFTGAPVPSGADTILIQENARRIAETRIEASESVAAGRHIRRAGLDFSEGEVVLAAGGVLTPEALALAASADHAELDVIRRPRVAVLMTGDELVRPGSPRGPHQIVASNGYGVAALAEAEGAVVVGLDLVSDDRAAIAAALARAREAEADILVSIGGASVGDYDLVNAVFRQEGVAFDFWKIAMRPGKPLMVGRMDAMRVLGLPGNPVSSFVCSHLFLRPLIARMAGRHYEAPIREAILGSAMEENDKRRDYVRARLETRDGRLTAIPFGLQDSSMMRVFAAADGLIIREPFEKAADAGEPCRVFMLR